MVKYEQIYNHGNCPFPNRASFFYNQGLYRSSLTEEFQSINALNVEFILQQAIWEFELLAGTEAYAGYYFVDWRIEFWELHEYVQQHLEELPQWAANYFLTLHDKAAEILYRRLNIE